MLLALHNLGFAVDVLRFERGKRLKSRQTGLHRAEKAFFCSMQALHNARHGFFALLWCEGAAHASLWLLLGAHCYLNE